MSVSNARAQKECEHPEVEGGSGGGGRLASLKLLKMVYLQYIMSFPQMHLSRKHF